MSKFNVPITSRKDKRDSAAEKVQLKFIKENCLSLIKERNGSIDLHSFDTKRSCHQYYMKNNGIIAERSDKGRVYNKFYDSKIFDSVVYLTINNKIYNLYFFCKWNENSGGHQDNIYKEMGNLMYGIKKHKNPNSVFIFLIDGEKWDNENFSDLDAPHNCIFCNTDNFKSKLIKYILK